MRDKETPVLEMKHISKSFYSNKVLEDVNFNLFPGEILGLVGENGAGKSTLMKILFGMDEIQQTGGYGGQMFIDGSPVAFSTSQDALEAGIGMVHQEFSLLPDFSAAENIALNREPVIYSRMSELFGDGMDRVDRKKMKAIATDSINKLGVDLDPDMPVSRMPVGHKQFTEIARELSKSDKRSGTTIRILVLDEPTAVLSEKEADALLVAMKKLSDQGIAIIFISHRLQEIIDVCDRIMVMRDGKIIRQVENRDVQIPLIAQWMVGRSVSISRDDKRVFDYEHTPVQLDVQNLWVNMPGETVRNVSMKVYEGEILGIGGLAGQGKLGIPNGIMGLAPAGGSITFNGEILPLNQPRALLDSGIAFVSEDRRNVGLLMNESIAWNIAFPAMQVKGEYLKQFGPVKFYDRDAIVKSCEGFIEKLQIKCTGVDQNAGHLSGGNQQKICLAKAFALSPSLLFVSEPTRGIDIGAKQLVLDALRSYNRDHGVTIVMVSSELEELRGICDRIAIVTDGKVAGVLPSASSRSQFGLMMVGKGGAA